MLSLTNLSGAGVKKALNPAALFYEEGKASVTIEPLMEVPMKKILEGVKNAARSVWGYFMKHKVFGIILAVVLILVLVGAVNAARKRTDSLSTLQTAELERGTLTATIGATGNVRANQSAVLNWQASGTVGAVHVQVGDQVQAGDILAELSPTSVSQSIILAQADLVTAQRNLDNLLNSNTQTAQAQLALVQAQKAYNSADATLDGFLGYNRNATSADIQNAEAQLTLAEQSLNNAQTFYNSVKDRPDTDATKAQAYTGLYNAQQAYTRAQNNLNYFLLEPSGSDLDEARAKLALAEAQLEDAQREWDRLKDGPDADDIRAAQARVDAAQAAVRMAYISAAFGGTVTEANPTVGDLVSPNTIAFRVDDLSRLLVDVQVSEIDINNIAVGQTVVVTFDAVLDQEYHGQVVQVDQAGTIVQGVVNFGVTVELTDPDEFVKPGMTAAVTITVQQLEDVLLVPNRAVRLVDGERVVYMLRNGVVEQVVIELGATSDTVSEVISGDIQAGDTIILNPTTDLFTPGERPGFMGP